MPPALPSPKRAESCNPNYPDKRKGVIAHMFCTDDEPTESAPLGDGPVAPVPTYSNPNE